MNANGTGSILGQCEGIKFNCVSMLAIIIIIIIIIVIINFMYTGAYGTYATGRLEDSGLQNDEKMSHFTTARKTSLEINSCPVVTICDCPILFAKDGRAGLVLIVLQRTAGTWTARAV